RAAAGKSSRLMPPPAPSFPPAPSIASAPRRGGARRSAVALSVAALAAAALVGGRLLLGPGTHTPPLDPSASASLAPVSTDRALAADLASRIERFGVTALIARVVRS